MEQYRDLIESGKYLKGLLVSESNVSIVYFNPEDKGTYDGRPGIPKSADLQAAIKAGTLTPELLQSELNRLTIREERAQEIDREKIQMKVHEQFENSIAELNLEPTTADLVAVRLILFQSLDYSARIKALQTLFGDAKNPGFRNGAELYRLLENMTKAQFAFLIHMAIASNPDSKYPKIETGYFFYKMAAGEAGLDLDGIEQEQKTKGREETGKFAGKDFRSAKTNGKDAAQEIIIFFKPGKLPSGGRQLGFGQKI